MIQKINNNFNINYILEKGIFILKKYNIVNCRLDAEILLKKALDTKNHLIYYKKKITQNQFNYFMELINDRSSYIPIAKILGYKDFWMHSFKVDSNVLDPRPDSEILIEAIIKKYKNYAKPLRILDLGTGSGCLFLSILHCYKNACGVAVDKSNKALFIARHNAKNMNLLNRANLRCINWEDLHRVFLGKFDIIISNPPYIRSLDCYKLHPDICHSEPHIALNGGANGIMPYRFIFSIAKKLLKPGGFLLCEVDCNNWKKLISLINVYNFSYYKYYNLCGLVRCLMLTNN